MARPEKYFIHTESSAFLARRTRLGASENIIRRIILKCFLQKYRAGVSHDKVQWQFLMNSLMNARVA
jgi:hypothetical protein